MRVAVVAEYYPSDRDPALGIWAHRQALAARDAGAEVRVLVLHRALPTREELRAGGMRSFARPWREPLRERLEGIEVRRGPFLSPPRPLSYGAWGACAAPSLALALRRMGREFRFDLVHAHYAAPAADAVLRSHIGAPLVVSIHGGDVLGVVERWPRMGAPAVRRALREAQLVLANSAGIEARCRTFGATRTRVLHLGTDLPPERAAPPAQLLLVTVGNLIERKRHLDVLEALWRLRDSHPQVRWLVVGDGPQRGALARRAGELGLSDRVELRGAVAPGAALAAARSATLFVLPSVEEAFGVAYIEAMAAGVPAIGCRGQPGPEEIARSGEGIRLVSARDPDELASVIAHLLDDGPARRSLGDAARRTVADCFTWERCGRETVEAYRQVLR